MYFLTIIREIPTKTLTIIKSLFQKTYLKLITYFGNNWNKINVYSIVRLSNH